MSNNPDDRQIQWLQSIPFIAVHVAAVVGVVLLGLSWRGLGLAVALYYVRMFWVTAGYHRYFSHRSFRTSRAFQLVLALLAMTSSQKGVLWWAGHHRVHHKYSDQEGDVHSVLRDGFLWGHVAWILSKRYLATDEKRVRDLAKFPELVWLDRWWWLPPTGFAVGLFAIGGWFALVWGFFVSTTLLWHGTFTINSLTHMFGTRRYATTDNSRNNPLLAAITLGEGWHNNHHYYQRSVRQGFFWWEIDPTYYVLRVLAWLGLVWDLHGPPAQSCAGEEATRGRPLQGRSDSVAPEASGGWVPRLRRNAGEARGRVAAMHVPHGCFPAERSGSRRDAHAVRRRRRNRTPSAFRSCVDAYRGESRQRFASCIGAATERSDACPMVRAGVAWFLVLGAYLLVPLGAYAQCGATTSECRNCHEVRAAKSVLAAPAPWHRDHAFGDFCALCHGGDPLSKDESPAHVGLVSPLADPLATCGSCHGAASESLAHAYVAVVATPRTPLAAPAPSAVAPSGPRAVAWRNVGLAGVVLLFGAVGASYVVTNERRLRDRPSPSKENA